MPPLRLTLCPHVHNLDLWGINAPFSPIVAGSKIQPIWLGGLECGGCGWSCGWRMSHSCGTSLITQLYLASPTSYLSHSRCPSLSSCSWRFRFLMQCCYINPSTQSLLSRGSKRRYTVLNTHSLQSLTFHTIACPFVHSLQT